MGHLLNKFPVQGLAVAGLLFNALVWGICWWPFKQLEQLGLHPLWATALVYGCVTLTIGLSLWRRAQLPRWREHPGLWWLLLASGLTNVGFNWAVTVGDVVRVVLLFYLMPAWSVAVAWLLLGERPGRPALLRLLLALTGLFIVLKRPDMPWPVPESLADGLALLGGLSFAVTNVLLFKLRASPESARMLAMFGGGALMAALTAVAGLLTGVVLIVVAIVNHANAQQARPALDQLLDWTARDLNTPESGTPPRRHKARHAALRPC